MEDNIKYLRNCIKENNNFGEPFKCNVATLTDELAMLYPQYDYKNLGFKLSNLNVTIDNSIENYSIYDDKNNCLKLNIGKIFEDRIDLQHLFLNEMLLIQNKSYEKNEISKGFSIGVSEAIASTMNSDESMKKLNALNYTAISAFSKIVDPEIILNGFMNNTMEDIVTSLEEKGIDKEEFGKLLNCFNNMNNKEPNTSFAEAQKIIINMYKKTIQNDLSNGKISFEDLKNKFDEFSQMLIFNNSELMLLYPFIDFTNVNGLDDVKPTLDASIVDCEIIDVNVPTK